MLQQEIINGALSIVGEEDSLSSGAQSIDSEIDLQLSQDEQSRYSIILQCPSTNLNPIFVGSLESHSSISIAAGGTLTLYHSRLSAIWFSGKTGDILAWISGGF